MKDQLNHHLAAARKAIIAANAPLALDHLDRFAAHASQNPPDPATRKALQSDLTQLRGLADAALEGAKSAVAQVQAIIESARSLQTYDDQGQRKVASVVAPAPRRF